MMMMMIMMMMMMMMMMIRRRSMMMLMKKMMFIPLMRWQHCALLTTSLLLTVPILEHFALASDIRDETG